MTVTPTSLEEMLNFSFNIYNFVFSVSMTNIAGSADIFGSMLVSFTLMTTCGQTIRGKRENREAN